MSANKLLGLSVAGKRGAASPLGSLSEQVLGAAPDAIIAIDEGDIVVSFNKAAEDLLGIAASTIVGRSLHEAMPGGPALVDALDAGLDSATVELGVLHLEVLTWRADTLRIAMLRDLSNRVLEDALFETEERLAGITSNVPGIVFQRMQSPDGVISYPFFTEGVRDVLGFEPEDIQANADGCLSVVHWADRDNHMTAIRDSAATLAPCIEDFRAITQSGEMRWLRGSSRPQSLPTGEILWDGVLIDVTDRKRAELRLEMLMDHAADGIVTFDEDGRMDSVNAAVEQIFGYTAAELEGAPVGHLMAEPFRSRQADDIAQYVVTGHGEIIGNRELIGQRKDGSTFPLELSTSEVRMEGRRIFIAIGRDITSRKRTEAALHETEQRLRNIAANLPGMVFQRVLRQDGSFGYTYVSDGCRDVLGFEAARLMADPDLFLAALSDRERERFLSSLRGSAKSLQPLDEEVRIERDGDERWLRGQSRPRVIENGDVVWDGVTFDVTDRKQAEERLEYLAYYDPVTGIGNRALFRQRFETAQAAAAGSSGLMAVLSLGIDRFSIVNATMGHAVGDQVLAAAGGVFASGLRRVGDVIARAGGDRFLMLLTGMEDIAGVTEAVELIRALSEAPVTVDGEEFDLSASIGVSVFPRDGESADILVKNADAALHRAKGNGPGTVQMFTEEMNALAVKTLSLQNRLRRALDHNEFVPYFQPQVDLVKGEIVGMEALVRWISPELGLVPPSEFIPVAEESGLIDTLCEQVLRLACRQNKAWQEDGLAFVPVAVNVSGRQFQNAKRLVQTVETVLRESRLEPRFLELELTESSAMRDADNAIAVVNLFKAMGVACSIDDFGTGYSSLSVLKRFPIQKLKIDRSFVSDVMTDMNDAAIVKAIIAMAHALRLKVVAEGVEVVPHLEYLKELGCDQIQGYLFSRPLPAAEMERMFVEKKRLAL